MAKRALSSGERKLFVFTALVLCLPLGVALFFNRINATPVVSIPPPPAPPTPNGYDLYVAAALATVRITPEVDSASDATPPTTPQARARQYSLARKTAWLAANTKALALFDQAMKTPSLAPPQRSFKAVSPFYARLRQLARDKHIQSNARWMRGDANGALQSGLDTVQMGHDVRRGGVILPTLVGIAIGAIGRSMTGDTIDKISAPQAKAAARRLEALLARRWNLAQVTTEEKYLSQAGMLEMFRENFRAPGSGLVNAKDLTFARKLRMLTISKQQIMDDIGADYDRRIANARLPYTSRCTPAPAYNDPFLWPELTRLRPNDARDLVGDRFLMLRLALRAYRLERGAYPPDLRALVPGYLKAVPADPFGGGEPVRYKKQGQSYLLWSIGPDGRDDGAKPIPARYASRPLPPGERRSGMSTFSDFEGQGDVVAGVNG